MVKKLKKEDKSENIAFLSVSKSAFSLLYDNIKTIAGLVLIHQFFVTGSFFSYSAEGGQTLLVSFLSLLTSLAIFNALGSDSRKTIREAFYYGTESLVRFMLLSFLMFLQFIPFAIGGYLFTLASVGPYNLNTFEWIGLGLVWLVLSIPTFNWITTTLVAFVDVNLSKKFPLIAYRDTKESMIGRKFYVARIILLLLIALIAFLIVNQFALLYYAFSVQASLFVTQAVLNILITPIVIAYLVVIHKRLNA